MLLFNVILSINKYETQYVLFQRCQFQTNIPLKLLI